MKRARWHLGLLPLLLLVVGTGVYAVLVGRDLAITHQRDLMQSYGAALAAERMRADAGRMDAALANSQRVEHALAASRDFRAARDAFAHELLAQSTEAAGTPRALYVAGLDEAFQRLAARGDQMLPTGLSGSLDQLAGDESALHELLAAIDKLDAYDYSNALATERQAERLGAATTRIMVAVIVAAFILSVLLSASILRTQRHMEATLISIPDPLFVVGRDGRPEVRNPAAEALAGTPEFAHGFLPELQARLDEAMATGRHFLPTGYDHLLMLRIGSADRCFLPRILVFGGGLGRFGGAAVLLQDVTRFRLLDDAKNNLVGTVSHELKTPLTSLRMAVYLLLEKSLGGLNVGQIDLLETARDDADRLLRILNDLLDLSRLESGVAQLHLVDVPVEPLLEEMAREVRQIAAVNGQTIVIDVARGVATVAVDRDRIRHVFNNLLSNAVKYSPEGGKVTLYAKPADDGFVRCGVLDEGPGIPQESLGRIFEKFYRLPGQKTNGAGLGLAIAREIVLAHGGSIGCENRRRRGTDFHFLLPGNSRPRNDTMYHPLAGSSSNHDYHEHTNRISGLGHSRGADPKHPTPHG